jgi:hypothetical protein
VSAKVVTLPTPLTADAAWHRYRRLAARMLADPQLILDRGFREQMHIAELAWKESFERSMRAG